MKYFTSIFLLTLCSSAVADKPETTGQLETTYVTADFTPTQIREATYSVDTISSETRELTNASHPSDLLIHTNAWVSLGSGEEHLTAIRSPVFTGAGACGNFLVSEDSIPTRSKGFCNVNQIFDTNYETSELIEIYRGPMSSSRGGNALFGGIDFSTPQFTQNKITARAYEDNHYGADWVLSNDTLLSYGAIKSKNSFRDDASVNQQKFGVKHKYKLGTWTHTQNLSVNNLEQETATFIQGINAFKNETLRTGNSSPEAYRDARSIRAYSRSSKQSKRGSLTITPYFRHHEMTFLMHFLPWQPTEKNQHSALGLDVRSSKKITDHVQFHSGVELESTKGKLEEFQNQPAPFAQDRFPVGAHYDYSVDNNTYAVFARADLHTNKRLNLAASVRYDGSHYVYDNHLDDGFACNENVTGCRFYRPEDKSDNFNHLSWKLAGSFRFNSKHSSYFNISSAHRAPQATELYRLQNDTQTALNSVKLRNYEVGLRSHFSSADMSIAAFTMLQKDGIYQDSNRSYITGAQTSHTGVEYDVHWRPLATLQLRLNGNYTQHKYENNPDALGVRGPIEGNDIDTAPRQLHSQQLSWQPNNGQNLTLSSVWHGKYYLDPENQHQYSGHWIQNLAYKATLSKTLHLVFSVENLSDRRFASRADFAFGEYRYFPAARRTIGISSHVKF